MRNTACAIADIEPAAVEPNGCRYLRSPLCAFVRLVRAEPHIDCHSRPIVTCLCIHWQHEQRWAAT